MMKKILPNLFGSALTVLTVTLLLLSITSCKKDDKNGGQNSDSIVGLWREDFSTGAEKRILYFNNSGSFYADLVRPPSADFWYSTSLKGTFKVIGDRLLFNVKEPGNTEDFKSISGAPFSGKIFENARFVVKGDKLTIVYTTYPADAPVETTSVYKRVRD